MQTKAPLTKRQKEALDFVVRFVATKGYSPSLQELADFLETSNLSTAQYFIQELQNKGYLKKKSNIARGIMPMTSATTIPILGTIAAGKPIEPIENPEDIAIPSSINIDERYPHYALTISGDSMIDMGVLDGDIAIIRHQLTAQEGEVIVAITEEGATLKVLRKSKNGKPYLEPKNKSYSNIYPNHLEVRGKFVGLIRQG